MQTSMLHDIARIHEVIMQTCIILYMTTLSTYFFKNSQDAVGTYFKSYRVGSHSQNLCQKRRGRSCLRGCKRRYAKKDSPPDLYL